MTFANNSDPDEAPQNVWLHLRSKLFDIQIINHQNIWEETIFFLIFWKKQIFEKVTQHAKSSNVKFGTIKNHILNLFNAKILRCSLWMLVIGICCGLWSDTAHYGRAAKPAYDAYLRSNPDRKKNKLSYIPKCSENLEVYHTAGRFFLFLGTIGAIQNGVQHGRQFSTTSWSLKRRY